MTPQSPSKESRKSIPPEKRAFVNPRGKKSSNSGGNDEPQNYLILGDLVIPLPKNKDTILGRDNDVCDLVLLNERVSKRHALISFRNGRYVISDTESVNGTFVNSKRIKNKHPLVVGDTIRLRPYNLLFAGPEHTQVAKSSQHELISDASKHGGHLSGRLNVVPITDVIQLLNSTHKSGILTLENKKNQRAKIVFLKGEIVAATYVGKFAEEAVYEALTLHNGTFDFLPGNPPPAPSPMKKKTISLLLEGCRLIDEGLPDETVKPSPQKSQKTRQILRIGT